jgi:endoglucanase Acf2
VYAQLQALGLIEGALTPWLRNDNRDLLIYDKTWGSLVTYDGLNDVNADFGNAW